MALHVLPPLLFKHPSPVSTEDAFEVTLVLLLFEIADEPFVGRSCV